MDKPRITHDTMRVTKDLSKKSQPQTFIVDDTSNDEVDQRLAQFEAPVKPQVTAVETKPMSKMLEKLVFIGRASRKVEIDESVFELCTLLNKEQDQIVKTIYQFKDPGDLFAVRSLTLAHALKSIDGVSLNDVDIEGDFESDFHKRIEIISCLQLSVVEKLFAEYEKMLGDSEKATDGKEIKNL